MLYTVSSRLFHYAQLLRLHRPIGILLFLWPALWALWLAGAGKPPLLITAVFIAGVIMTRSAGCVANDIADRRFDGNVTRTRDRPLVSGKVSLPEAYGLLALLAVLAVNLLWLLNDLTRWLTLPLILLTLCYPLMKRVTHLPQLVLGLTANWSIPMAFAAITGAVPPLAWLLFTAACVWTVAYDSIYAMVDREDDLRIGVKSTAILFGAWDTGIVAVLHGVFLGFFVALGYYLQAPIYYYAGVLAAAAIMIYQQVLIHSRSAARCFRAFRVSHWAGCALFVGLVFSF